MDATTTRLRSLPIAILAAIMAVFAALAVALPQQAFADDSALAAGQIKAQASSDDDSSWTRLAGPIALDTMAAIVDEGWTTSDVAVITTVDGYWDALAAASVAGQANAPVLMTDGTTLSSQTAQVLAKLKPSKIIVVGGPAAVADSVGNAAKAATGATTTVERLWGQDAIGTANDVFANGAKMTGGSWNANGTAFIATNDGYWDALAAAPVSYASGAPIFLADGHSAMTADTIKAMNDGGIKNVYIVGGEAAIEPSVEKQLKDAGFTINARLGGATAVETSVEVAKAGILDFDMSPKNLGIATMNGYWDALTGAALCGLNNSPLVLAEDESSASITGFTKMTAGGIDQGYIFGGEAALPLSLDPALEKMTDEAAPEPTPEPSVDKSALEQAIADASAIEQGNKSDDAKAALDEAIAEAKAVADDEDATQDEVDAAVEALEEAVTEFENSPDEPAAPETVTVSYVTNNGSTIEPVTLEKGSELGSKNVPEIFNADGAQATWYDNEAFEGKAYGRKSVIDKDTTLYAKYGDYMTVVFVGADGAEIASKTYHSKSDLTEAVEPSTTDPQSGFFNYKSDGNGAFSSVSVQTATEYITLESLLKDAAGADETASKVWSDVPGATVKCEAADGFGFTRAVGDLKAGKVYSAWDGTDAGTPVTACLAMKWLTTDWTAAGDFQSLAAAQQNSIANASENGSPRAIYGITEGEFGKPSTIPAGNKQPSYVCKVTVTLPAEG